MMPQAVQARENRDTVYSHLDPIAFSPQFR